MSVKASVTINKATFQVCRRVFSSTGTTNPSRKKIWFKDKGLTFACTACGKCCTGRGGKVWVNAVEAEIMAEELDVKVETLRDRYLRLIPREGKWSIRTREESEDDRCIFLNEKNHCSLYAARPTQCRTFPWWPQIVASDHDWKVAAKTCEGIQENAPAVSSKTVLENLVVHSVHRNGEEDFTYSGMMDNLKEIDPELINEFEDDFVRNHSRQVLHENDRIVVLNNRMGMSRQTRSLYFKNSLNYSQSEIAIQDSTGCLDYNRLIFDVHEALCLALVWIHSPIKHMAVIGTGAGAIPMFLHHNFPEATMDCIDASAEVLDLAQQFFSLPSIYPFRLLAQNGESYSSPHPLDILIIDVATDTIPVHVPPTLHVNK